MRRFTARAVLASAGLAILLAVAGCGGDGNKSDTGLPGFDGARVSWGEPDGGDPTALMMLLHGGGWQRSDSGYEEQKANAKVVQEQGYATVAVGYDAGAKGFQQVVDVYKAARQRYPDLPICAVGISAGGNLALNLATREPDLDCVVGLSAPTDLTTIARQDPKGQEAYKAAVTAFGKDALVRFSPARHADSIRAKVLLIAADTDPIVPAAQSRELAQALPGAQLVDLSPGPDPVQWAHFGAVQPNAQQIVIQREFGFLKQATAAQG
jgi:dipeptidyl aminopeptidase/acylaminoacyl peptidase